MDDYFRNLQIETNSLTSIGESRKVLNDLVAYFKDLPFQEEQRQFFANLRELKVSTLTAVDSFMVPDDLLVKEIPEEFRHDSYGFVEGSRIIYSGRYVFPIKDVTGDVAGFVGYDKFEEPKYLDSKNYGYKAKQTMIYGMETLYDEDYIVMCEGSVCKLFMQQEGIHSGAFLGSHMTPYVIEILKRFKRRCLVIPDADDAGNKLKWQVKKYLPEAFVVQSKIAKDIDDSRKIVGCDEIAEDIKRKIANPFTVMKYFE